MIPDLGNGQPLHDREVSRRDLLKTGAGVAAAGYAAGAFALPPGALAKRGQAWPDERLPASAGEHIVSTQFLSKKQLTRWGREVDRIGLRATGSRAHEDYVRKLAKRMRRAGLENVRREAVPMRRWIARSWSVRADGHHFEHTYYMPYTHQTPPGGLTAPMAYVGSGEEIDSTEVKGKIAVFDVPYTVVSIGSFEALSYPGAFQIASGDPRGPETEYKRPWFNGNIDVIEQLIAAGATAMIGIWSNLPGRWARQYTPYDGVFRPIPGLWVDSNDGAKLRDLAGNGARATVKLDANVKHVKSHNLIGFIPGKSKELTVLHTHTDGTNGTEENGQIPILATAQYLARLPRKARDRTIMVFLSTGHFAGGVGIKRFLKVHADDLVPRSTSLLTLEHVGCTEWLPNGRGKIKPTGHTEFAGYFGPSSKGLIDALVSALKRDRLSGSVVRPFTAAPPDAIEPVGWPGEGSYLWMYGSLLDGNYITGPYGLITADIDTTGMVDYKLMRKQAMGAVKTVLQLASTSNADLAEPAS
jgi:hypothetical protein